MWPQHNQAAVCTQLLWTELSSKQLATKSRNSSLAIGNAQF